MKNKELKTIWKLSKTFWFLGFLLWLVETIIFLIVNGWHLKATNKIEKYCDKIVLNMWQIALSLTVLICFYYLIKLNEKSK